MEGNQATNRKQRQALEENNNQGYSFTVSLYGMLLDTNSGEQFILWSTISLAHLFIIHWILTFDIKDLRR